MEADERQWSATVRMNSSLGTRRTVGSVGAASVQVIVYEEALETRDRSVQP